MSQKIKMTRSLIILMSFLSVIGICGLCGCCLRDFKDSKRQTITNDGGISKEQAVRITQQEIVRRGWTGLVIEERDVYRTANGWWVTVWSLPKGPGKQVAFEISSEGKIVRLIPGE